MKWRSVKSRVADTYYIYNKLEGKERHYWTANINSNKKIPINKDLFTWIRQVYVEVEKGEIFLQCVKDFVEEIFVCNVQKVCLRINAMSNISIGHENCSYHF